MSSQYDGARKYITSDCSVCPFLVREPFSRRILARHTLPKKHRPHPLEDVAFCIWGEAIKRLVSHEKPARACALTNKPSSRAAKWMALVADPIDAPEPLTLPLVATTDEPHE